MLISASWLSAAGGSVDAVAVGVALAAWRTATNELVVTIERTSASQSAYVGPSGGPGSRAETRRSSRGPSGWRSRDFGVVGLLLRTVRRADLNDVPVAHADRGE